MYEDEVIFQQSGSATRSWAVKGQGREVKSQPGRQSEKLLGCVSAESEPRFHFRFAQTFNTESFHAFLLQIVRHEKGRKIHLVLDNVRYHHAKAIRPWLEQNRALIELHFLPAYSPHLNPIEAVWKFTKKASIHNRHFPTLKALRRTLFRRFNRYQGNPASLRPIMASACSGEKLH